MGGDSGDPWARRGDHGVAVRELAAGQSAAPLARPTRPPAGRRCSTGLPTRSPRIMRRTPPSTRTSSSAIAANGISGIETALGMLLAAVDAGLAAAGPGDRGADDRPGRGAGPRIRRPAYRSRRGRPGRPRRVRPLGVVDGDSRRARLEGQELAAARPRARGPGARGAGRRSDRARSSGCQHRLTHAFNATETALGYAAGDDRSDPEYGLRAEAVLARVDAAAARSARSAASGLGRRCGRRRWLRGDHGRPRARSAGRIGQRSSRRRPSASVARRATAGSSIPATSGGPGSSSSDMARTRVATSSASARGVRPRQAAHRRGVDRLRVPRVRLSRSRLRAEPRRRPPQVRGDSWLVRCRGAVRAARSASRGDRVRRVLRRACRCGERPAPPRQVTSAGSWPPRSGLARTSTRAFGRGRCAGRADGRMVVETDRGAIIAKDVVVGTNGYTDGLVPSLRRRIIPIGSYIIATEPLPEELARELSPKGRAFFDTKNFLYYWHVSADRRMIFGGRASFMPTSVDRTAAILHRGPARGPSAARRLPRRLRLGRQRRLHVRSDATRRARRTA